MPKASAPYNRCTLAGRSLADFPACVRKISLTTFCQPTEASHARDGTTSQLGGAPSHLPALLRGTASPKFGRDEVFCPNTRSLINAACTQVQESCFRARLSSSSGALAALRLASSANSRNTLASDMTYLYLLEAMPCWHLPRQETLPIEGLVLYKSDHSPVPGGIAAAIGRSSSARLKSLGFITNTLSNSSLTRPIASTGPSGLACVVLSWRTQVLAKVGTRPRTRGPARSLSSRAWGDWGMGKARLHRQRCDTRIRSAIRGASGCCPARGKQIQLRPLLATCPLWVIRRHQISDSLGPPSLRQKILDIENLQAETTASSSPGDRVCARFSGHRDP